VNAKVEEDEFICKRNLDQNCFRATVLFHLRKIIGASDAQACAGTDGFADSRKLSAFEAIARLVHQHEYLPIELVCLLVCGSTMRDAVKDSYYDASWQLRHRAYDTMNPDEVRAAARAARQYTREHGADDVVCRAFALIAAEESTEHGRLNSGLRKAAESSRKRKLSALEENFEPRPPGVANLDVEQGIGIQDGTDVNMHAIEEGASESDEVNADYWASLGM
jgi:hypothetical protein